MNNIFCTKCNLEKSIDNFSAGRNECKNCKKIYNANYYIVNNDKIKQQQLKYREINKDYKKKYNQEYYSENKNDILEQKKDYYNNYFEKISNYKKIYRENNREKINKNQNKYKKIKRKNNQLFRFKNNISRIINMGIKNNGSSKCSMSCFKYLPYTISVLKEHIESLFEPWMNWENQGVYRPKEWDDNDPTTWKWQLDHIIPHSTFRYDNMECEEFRQCWALSNLRPLSAKQNQLDGATKSRHIKYRR